MKFLDIQPLIAGTVGKCYPLVAPPNTVPPYAVYLRSSFVDDACMDGTVADLQNNSIEVTVYAKTYLEAVDLSERVRASFYGELAVQTSGYDNYDPVTQLFGVTQEFSIFFAYDANGIPRLLGSAANPSSTNNRVTRTTGTL